MCWSLRFFVSKNRFSLTRERKHDVNIRKQLIEVVNPIRLSVTPEGSYMIGVRFFLVKRPREKILQPPPETPVVLKSIDIKSVSNFR
jgi:hypothetical protein